MRYHMVTKGYNGLIMWNALPAIVVTYCSDSSFRRNIAKMSVWIFVVTYCSIFSLSLCFIFFIHKVYYYWQFISLVHHCQQTNKIWTVMNDMSSWTVSAHATIVLEGRTNGFAVARDENFLEIFVNNGLFKMSATLCSIPIFCLYQITLRKC
jgi:hypothetical protein